MLKSTYFATKEGNFFKDLPYIYTNICQAAEWLDKQSQKTDKELKIFERLPTIGSDGSVYHRNKCVTEQCTDILMDYYGDH